MTLKNPLPKGFLSWRQGRTIRPFNRGAVEMVANAWLWLVCASALIGGLLLGWGGHAQVTRARHQNWPKRWNLQPRPLLNAHERALFRELRSALPQHVVLAKVNLLRFCQAADSRDARAWYDRLQALNVSLLVCTANGVVISAIDLESQPPSARSTGRSQKLKEATLEACRVRYLRARPNQWPQGALIAAWALGQDIAAAQGDRNGDEQLNDAGDQLARKLKARRAERAAMWAESSFAQDSFFAFDSRFDGVTSTGPVPLTDLNPPRSAAAS